MTHWKLADEAMRKRNLPNDAICVNACARVHALQKRKKYVRHGEVRANTSLTTSSLFQVNRGDGCARSVSHLTNDASSSEFLRIEHPPRAETKTKAYTHTHTPLAQHQPTMIIRRNLWKRVVFPIRTRREHSCLMFPRFISFFLFPMAKNLKRDMFRRWCHHRATFQPAAKLPSDERVNKRAIRDHWQPSLFSVPSSRSLLSSQNNQLGITDTRLSTRQCRPRRRKGK